MVMIHINQFLAAVATAVLFLLVVIAPQWTKAQPLPPMAPMPKVDPVCTVAVSDILQNCYSTLSALPSDEFCKGLKSASTTQVNCLCDNFIAHPVYINLTRSYYNQINTGCDVLDKYACNGTSEGGDPKGGDGKGGNGTGGAKNKIVVSMGLFGFITSLFFFLF